MPHLIINADDFGMSKVFNECIIQLLSENKLTSTTVMVNRLSDIQKGQVQQLKHLIPTIPISVGLHVEFTYDDHMKQIQNQFEIFCNVFGLAPSHLDIHKEHLHRKYHHLVAEFCQTRDIPFRNHGTNYKGITTTDDKFFFGSIEKFQEINKWLKNLQSNRSYELVFHPGTYDPYCYSSMNIDRKNDLFHIEKIYQNKRTYNINLINFKELKKINR